MIVIAIHFRDAPELTGLAGTFGGAADAIDGHPEAFESLDVNRGDETGADDAGTELVKGRHGIKKGL
jgi:hypothetical protein